MLSDQSSLPINFGTPPRKRQHFAMSPHPLPHQQRKEHSQGHLSLAKSISQPSTVGSPFLRPSTKGSLYELELTHQMLQDFEKQQKCRDFFGKGQCGRGQQCPGGHCWKVVRRASKLERLTNFPELMEVERNLRVRSFLA